MNFFIIHEVHHVISGLFAVMVCYLDTILQVVHKDAVSLTDVSCVDVCDLLNGFSYCMWMLARIDLR